MTDSKIYDVAGAEVTITATVYTVSIELHITVDLSSHDAHLSDHSPHNLINYFDLRGYEKSATSWWCKKHRAVTVKTGSQARRVVKNALVKIDDAVSQALIDRDARLAHKNVIFMK